MKALFVVGLAVVVLGILSFFVALPHSENHGIKAGDVSVGVQTHSSEKVSPAISAVHAGSGSRTYDCRPQELAASNA